MSIQQGEAVAKSGTYLYAEEVVCDIRIVFSAVCYGSGDRDDPPEVADDQERETFYIQYGSTTLRGQYTSSGVGYRTLSEAVDAAHAAPGTGHTIRWGS